MNTPHSQPIPPFSPVLPYNPKDDWLYKLLGPVGKKKLLQQHRLRPARQ